MKLKVIQPFGGHAVGDEITDPGAVAAILQTEQAHYVVKLPDDPAPKPAQADTGK